MNRISWVSPEELQLKAQKHNHAALAWIKTINLIRRFYPVAGTYLLLIRAASSVLRRESATTAPRPLLRRNAHARHVTNANQSQNHQMFYEKLLYCHSKYWEYPKFYYTVY